MDHIAHRTDLDGHAFHLVDPKGERVGRRAEHVRQGRPRAADGRCASTSGDGLLPKGVISTARCSCRRSRTIRRAFSADLGHPRRGVEYVGADRAASTRATPSARSRLGIELPPLESYADKLWDYWERNLDPDLFKDRSFEGAVNGKTVVITGASSGIGRAAALKIAAAGGIPILVARTREARGDQGRDRGRRRHRLRLLVRPRRPGRDRRLVKQLFDDHAAIDMLVNNAGRSIRRSVALSYDRFHDFERTIQPQLLRPDQADAWACCRTCASAGAGHIVNVSSIGVQTNPPRFCAYVASKAALDAWTRVVTLGVRSATTSRSRRSTCRWCGRR